MSDVCSQLLKEIDDEANYWKNILKRVVSVIRFLACRGLAFRGTSNHVGDENNGNYLGMLELLAQYDTVLATHIKRHANKGRGHVSYLSHIIANEFIQVLAELVRSSIVDSIKTSKYFAIIVDSTPDVSHVDQLVIVFRYVDQTGRPLERFIEFVPNAGHKGKDMETVVVDSIVEKKISIMDCRGQSYDNASNMSGKFQGLQARIKQRNPLAVHVPCETHTLNLTVCHSAESSEVVVHFFLFIQNIYVFFSSSTNRWDILIQFLRDDLCERNIKDERLLVPKRLNTTRWCARADACRAIKTGYKSFIKALTRISENVQEKQFTRVEAKTLRDKFFLLETAILVEFWSTILHRVKTTSKSLQGQSMDIEKSILLHQSLITYFEKMRTDNSFNEFELKGRSLITENRAGLDANSDLRYNCYNKRERKRNTRYDIGNGPETVLEGRDKFRIECFFTALDSILADLRLSTKLYEETMMPFAFLFSLDSQTLSDEQLRTKCEQLQSIYYNDLDEDLYDECQQFKCFMEDINNEAREERERRMSNDSDEEHEENQNDYQVESKMMSKSSRMLVYITKTNISSSFPNIHTALRIFETIAISNAAGERAFSMLKRVKGPLRSAHTQDNLNSLAMLYANSDVLKEIDCDEAIHSFAQGKARRKTFGIK